MQREPQRMRSQTVFVLALIGILLFGGGFLAGQRTALSDGPHVLTQAFARAFKLTSVDPALLSTIVEKIGEKYFAQPVDNQALLYGAAAGLVSGLGDPYSAFFPPEESRAFQEEITGTFDGIGVEVGIRDDRIAVIAPLAGSPAETAGILAGDAILMIDGVSTAYMTLDEAISHIRGEKGTEVTLTLGRDGETPEITVVRDTIVVQSASWERVELPEGKGTVGLVTLSSFTRETNREFDDVVAQILLANPDGMILDLRNNPGGFLDIAIDIAGHFVGQQIVVIERSGDGTQETFQSEQQKSIDGIPIVVLVNEGTASASEILAGALQDYGLATLIGAETFGKGTVQELEQLTGGSSLKLTVAEWLTPKGRSLAENGLTPDVLVEMTEDDYTQGRDPQRDAAITFFVERAER